MKSTKVILIFLFFVFVLSVSVFHAQDAKSAQTILSLSNDKNSPFKDNETTIADVTFTGLDSYDDSNHRQILFDDEEEAREILYLNRWGQLFFPNWKFNRDKVKQLIAIIKEKADKSGYLEAKVSAMGEMLPENKMRLIVSVDKGEIARVSDIRFIGNKNVLSEELIEAFKEREENWHIFRKFHYKHYLEDSSQKLLFSRGFLQAKIKRILPEKTPYGYIVTIEVEEGIRYRIGDIKIEGTKVLSEKEVLEILNQNVGDVADGRDLQLFFEEKLKRIYADKGYIQYVGTFAPNYVKPQAEGLDGIVDVRATIDEGRAYKISKVYFWEIEESKADELRSISGLKVNDIYSESALETAVKNIDNTQEFEAINLGFSVRLQVDEDTGEVEIDFCLSKKNNS